MPAITVLLRAGPDGKEEGVLIRRYRFGERGRTRPTTALPTVVMVRDPATAISIRISGVRDRPPPWRW